MKKQEELNRLRDLSDEELRSEVARLKESMFRLRFRLSLGETDAVKRVRDERKTLARVQTLLRQRALEQV